MTGTETSPHSRYLRADFAVVEGRILEGNQAQVVASHEGVQLGAVPVGLAAVAHEEVENGLARFEGIVLP